MNPTRDSCRDESPRGRFVGSMLTCLDRECIGGHVARVEHEDASPEKEKSQPAAAEFSLDYQAALLAAMDARSTDECGALRRAPANSFMDGRQAEEVYPTF